IEIVLLGDGGDLGLWANEDRLDQSCLGRLDGAFEGGLVARVCDGSRNRLQFLCCGDEAIVLFVTARRRRGWVLFHGCVLLEARPAKRRSAQIARMRPMWLRAGWRLRWAGGPRAILLRPSIL